MSKRISVEDRLEHLEEYTRITKKRSEEIILEDRQWKRKSIEHMNKNAKYNRSIEKLIVLQTAIFFIMMLLMAFFVVTQA